MKNPRTSLALVGLLCVAASATTAGCGNKDAPATVVQASQTQIDNAVKMREYFVKAGGKYESLSAEDKAAYVKLAGDEAAGQAQWQTMSKNPSSAPSASGDPRTGQ